MIRKNIAAAMTAHMITPTTANVPATADLLAQKPSDVAAAMIAVSVALDGVEEEEAVEVAKSMVNVVELVAALISVVALTTSEETAVVTEDNDNVDDELLLNVVVVVGVSNGNELEVDEEVVIGGLEDVLVEEVDVLDVDDEEDCDEKVGENEPLLDVVEIVDVTVEVETNVETVVSRTESNEEVPEKEASVVLVLVNEPVCWFTEAVEFGSPLPDGLLPSP